MALRAHELSAPPKTIYFGGGSPSILSAELLSQIFDSLHQHFDLSSIEEITLESNPDDHRPEQLKHWLELGINRLSIGIQSFVERDLRWMNRAHNASQAMECVDRAKSAGFSALSLDLIYGIPNQSAREWEGNLQHVIDAEVDHVSAYCLTIESKTVLHHQLTKGQFKEKDDSDIAAEYQVMEKMLAAAGFEHYEISNFGRPNKHAGHNSQYWNGSAYLGLGPSAHSFDGFRTRSWNVANNAQYIAAIRAGNPKRSVETLTDRDRFNEQLMTSLRTAKGLSKSELNPLEQKSLEAQVDGLPNHLKSLVMNTNDSLQIPSKHWLLADAIVRELFL